MLNRVMLMGNLGRDPELRFLGSGKAVAQLSVATSEQWTDADGQKQERTEWHKVVVWGEASRELWAVPHEGPASLRRGRDPQPRVPGQGRPEADRDGDHRAARAVPRRRQGRRQRGVGPRPGHRRRHPVLSGGGFPDVQEV